MNDQSDKTTASQAEVNSASKKASSSLLVSLAALTVSIISAYFSYLNASTAGNALQLSELDRQRTERAYLSIDDEQLLRFKVGHSIKWAFQVRNMGHTPALRASIVARWRVRANDAQAKPIDNALKAWRDDPEAGSINEHYSKALFTRAPLTLEQYRSLKLEENKLELSVAIRYLDVFGKVHTTRLCAVFGRFESGEWGNGRCKSGNNSD